MAPTVSRSSLAGAVAAIVGLASASGGCGGADKGRSKGAVSAAGALGLRIGPDALAFAGSAWEAGGAASWAAESSVSSSVRLRALSIADIAAETGSVAGFCFAIMTASLDWRRSQTIDGRANASPRPGFEPTETHALTTSQSNSGAG